MNAALLVKIFGHEQRWLGPCTVVLDAEAAVQTMGVDSILGGGAKSYAPRMVSGRVSADAACLLPNGLALVLMQQQKTRGSSGEESIKQVVIVADTAHVVAVEFADTAVLASLGLPLPPGK